MAGVAGPSTAVGAQAGKVVRTVCGDRPADRYAAVLVHEHLLFDIAPPGADTTGDAASITMETRWQIDYLSNATPENARQQDAHIAARELCAFVEDGGDLIVDQSVHGLARDAEGLRRASETARCDVVACAGTYTAPYLDAETAALDVEALTVRFVREVTEGLDGTAIRAGLIGEIGCSWPLAPVERTALTAAARAAAATGAGLSVHPGRHPDAPFEIVRLVEQEGVDLSRCVICHMDRTYPDGRGVADLARTGVMVEWDFFGIETSHYWMGDVELPTDRGRLRMIRDLFDRGLEASILISQDICTRTRMKHLGGHGYGHIPRNVRLLMTALGFCEREIAQLLSVNPLRLLAMPGEAAL